jgi:6-phosphogluconolactonase
MERNYMIPLSDYDHIQIEPDLDSMAKKVCDLVVSEVHSVIRKKGFFTLVLSGGKTPQEIYKILAKKNLPWPQIHLFWGDERQVPIDSPESNFKIANDYLISKVPLPPENIHRIQGELKDAKEAANNYSQDLRKFFGEHQMIAPEFDLILLGLGEDGHTASLFPTTDYLNKSEDWVSSFWIEKLNSFRISLLPRIINETSLVLVLVAGKNKSKIVAKVLGDRDRITDYPILSIQPRNGKMIWILDEEASSQMQT